MELPLGTVAALDARRRAFIWAGTDKVCGAQCLVAWEKICVPKEQGGLGLKDLQVQNQCFMLKLLHRLHPPGDSSWARWARQRVNLATLEREMEGEHWASLRSVLPLYRTLTMVKVGNGTTTSFWDDAWLRAEPQAEVLPTLQNHAIRPNASVHTRFSRVDWKGTYDNTSRAPVL